MYIFMQNNLDSTKTTQMRFPMQEPEMLVAIRMLRASAILPVARIDTVRDNADLAPLLDGMEVNLDELNRLSMKLEALTAQDRNIFYALAETVESPSMQELINFSYCTHCYNLVSDFSNLEEQGKQLMQKSHSDVPQELYEQSKGKEYILHSLKNKNNLNVTSYGFLWENGIIPTMRYVGTHLPLHNPAGSIATLSLENGWRTEYLYLPYSDREKQVALYMLGCPNAEECTFDMVQTHLPQNIRELFPCNALEFSSQMNTLNKVCEQLQEIGISEMNYVERLLNYVRPATPSELVAVLDSCYDFTLHDGIHTAEEYGKYMICDSGHFEYDANLEAYIDFEAYGEDRLARENGAFTELGYIVYNGYNQDLAQLLQRNLGLDALPSQHSELKIYMPLQGETYDVENDYGDYEYTGEAEDISARELLQYQDEIERAITRYDENSMPERGLMEYYDKKDAINTKVHRLTFAVEAIEDELMGVATLVLKAPLEESELSAIKQYIEGTAADGWGEGFEQREIYCDGRNINVSFWSSGRDWSLQTADELDIEKSECQMPQMGMQM